MLTCVVSWLPAIGPRAEMLQADRTSGREGENRAKASIVAEKVLCSGLPLAYQANGPGLDATWHAWQDDNPPKTVLSPGWRVPDLPNQGGHATPATSPSLLPLSSWRAASPSGRQNRVFRHSNTGEVRRGVQDWRTTDVCIQDSQHW